MSPRKTKSGKIPAGTVYRVHSRYTKVTHSPPRKKIFFYTNGNMTSVSCSSFLVFLCQKSFRSCCFLLSSEDGRIIRTAPKDLDFYFTRDEGWSSSS